MHRRVGIHTYTRIPTRLQRSTYTNMYNIFLLVWLLPLMLVPALMDCMVINVKEHLQLYAIMYIYTYASICCRRVRSTVFFRDFQTCCIIRIHTYIASNILRFLIFKCFCLCKHNENSCRQFFRFFKYFL